MRLFLLLVAGFACLSHAETEEAEPERPKFLVIDVRTPAEFGQGHADGAINIEYGNIDREIARVAPDKKTVIYLYCLSGARAGSALRSLRRLGYKKAENVGTLKAMTEKLKRLQEPPRE